VSGSAASCSTWPFQTRKSRSSSSQDLSRGQRLSNCVRDLDDRRAVGGLRQGQQAPVLARELFGRGPLGGAAFAAMGTAADRVAFLRHMGEAQGEQPPDGSNASTHPCAGRV
jgi:hypothetical protein